MRRFYNNGTSFIETITKGTPGGVAGSIIKKIIKSKEDKKSEDKKSRNPDPKTPKMMGTDKETKDKTEIPKRLGRDDEIKRKQFKEKFPKFKYERPIGKLPLKVKKQRSNKKMNDMMLRYPEGKELDSETTKKIKKLKLFRKD